MNDVGYIRELYAYNRWANHRTMEAAAQIDSDKFVQHLTSSFPSVRDTLLHIMGGEWIWLERWNGRSPNALLTAPEIPDVATLRRLWERIESDQDKFLARLDAAALVKPLRYTNTSGQEFEHPLWEQMVHVANHSTYHRGQVATLLRQLGAKPASTDLAFFLRDRSSTAGAGR